MPRAKGKFYIVPQSEEEIERNRIIIEDLRACGLLEGHEKTFRVEEDGDTVKSILENQD